MAAAPHPHNESARLRALVELDILDSAPERDFDALVQTAALACGVPISLVSLVDEHRQWFKASVGLPGVTERPREQSFCAHAILDDGLLEVSDATCDPRFADSALVTAAPHIRFYAGVTLRLSSGLHVGTLCVIDRQPRKLDPTQREILRQLAVCAVRALESRRTAQRYAESEARLRALCDGAPLGVFATDPGGSCLFTNPRWQQIFGLTLEQSIGDGWSRHLHPDDRAGVFAGWQRAAAQRSDFDQEFRVRRGDGTVRLVRALSRPVVDADGAVSGHIGFVEDVTERSRTQRALDDERQRLASIIEGTGAGTWEWNVQTGETRFNERWAQIIGHSLADLEPLSIPDWFDRTSPDDLQRSTELLERHFAGELPAYECESRMRHRDGRWVWVLDRGRVLTWTAEGKPEWMFGTHVDITARKQEQEALRKSQQLLNRTGEVAGVGGWEVDLVTGIITWSEQTCRIHGVEPGYRPQWDEAIDFYAPEARPIIRAAIARAMAEGGGWDVELPFVRANGSHIWVRAVGQAEFENQKCVRLSGAFQDITERVKQRQALESAHERIALATDSGGIGVWDLDVESGTMSWDRSMRRLYGLPESADDFGIDAWARCLHPDDRDRTVQALQEALACSQPFDDEFRIVRGDGQRRHLRAVARVTRDAHGRATRMVGVSWDVTDLRQLAAELAGQHELLRVTLQSIGDGVITTDAAGRVNWLNPVAEHMTGWLTADATGRPLAQVFAVVDEETSVPLKNPVDACLEENGTGSPAKDGLLVARNGGRVSIEDHAAAIRNQRGEILGVVLVFRDVTEQRRLSSELRYRATHDALTGMVNRPEFERRLRRVLSKARADRSEHALMYVDLDQFKLVNDACGHAAGDQLLLQVSHVLAEVVRSRDTWARLGGDEFAVILEHCTSAQAQRTAQEICDRMDDFRFVHDGRAFRIGASIGLVPIDSRWATSTALMQAADSSCYAAKETGRNRVHTWFDTDRAVRARDGQTQWATRLEHALEHDRFVLYAQRIDSWAGKRQAIRAEVLLRMLDDDGDLVLPGAFLPAAERFRLAPRIDLWVLRQVIEVLGSPRGLQNVDALSVNIAGASIADRAFRLELINLLTAAGAAVCGRICLEIAETSVIANVHDVAAFVGQVRALGVRVALDDFGAGASSFGYLRVLKADMLKIDGQFTKNLVDDPLACAAVRCFVDVAQVSGLQAVAKCVDRPGILARVRDIGVDAVQGYLLHEPEPLERVLAGSDQIDRDPGVEATNVALPESALLPSASAQSAGAPIRRRPYLESAPDPRRAAMSISSRASLASAVTPTQLRAVRRPTGK